MSENSNYRTQDVEWCPTLTPLGHRVEFTGYHWIRYGANWMPALRQDEKWWLCGEDWPAGDPDEIGGRLVHG